MSIYQDYDHLQERVHQLERLNRFLEYKNTLLNEAIETICCAFLNNPRDLDTAIQTAMTLQQRAQQAEAQRQLNEGLRK